MRQNDDTKCWFKPPECCGEHAFNLADPYQRAVTMTILRLAAEERLLVSNCSMVQNTVVQQIDLQVKHHTLPVHTADSNPLLKTEVADAALMYFDKYDTDGNGS